MKPGSPHVPVTRSPPPRAEPAIGLEPDGPRSPRPLSDVQNSQPGTVQVLIATGLSVVTHGWRSGRAPTRASGGSARLAIGTAMGSTGA